LILLIVKKDILCYTLIIRKESKMKSINSGHIASLIIIMLFVAALSCSPGQYLRTEINSTGDISGNITLILYRGAGPMKVAVFDIEGDDYSFEMYGSKHNYVVENRVPAEIALTEAMQFIDSQRHRMKKVLDEKGSIIGYELRPLYNSLRYGSQDILDVSYRIADNKVIVTVEYKHSIRQNMDIDLFGGS
jgi:hypothetical protein